MKTFYWSAVLTVSMVCAVTAQTTPPVEDQLSTLWKQKNYTKLQALFDAKISANPPDVLALCCAKCFYVFVQPDRDKALAALTRLKQVAEATTDADFIAFANGELEEVQGIPLSGYTPTPAVVSMFHAEFPDKYPNVEIGARLRRYKKP